MGYFGQCFGLSRGLAFILCRISELLNYTLPVLLALGVVYFVWGVVRYVIGDSEEAKKKGKDQIVFGIIGFAVIISLWGLVYILAGTFGFFGQDRAPTPAEINNLLPTR